MFSFDGLISGIDSRTIIEGLTPLQQRQIDRFQVRQDTMGNQQKSIQGLEARVLSLRASMGQWNRTTNNASQKKQPLGLIFIDVDKFKLVNDNFGHAAGDQAIVSVANWIKQSIRDNDLAIRMGGDEFVIVFQNIMQPALMTIIKRILSGPPQMKLADGELIEINLSLGCIHVAPTRKTTIDPNQLLDQADQLM